MLSYDYTKSKGFPNNITADVIILGCSLPGIVTAHKLKKTFGDTMDVVVLDLDRRKKMSRSNVSFFQEYAEEVENAPIKKEENKDNVGRFYLTKFANEFDIQLPDSLRYSETLSSPLFKLFEHVSGSTAQSTRDYHDFAYLNFLERFELKQYQNLLDQNLKDLFQFHDLDVDVERAILHHYDNTTMEQHICEALVFSTPREIMRTTVRLICGAPSDTVSVLFYMHQCFRTNSCRNQLGGDNIRLREKLLGYCRRRITSKLQESVADITVPATTIKEIRAYSNEQLIVKTNRGDESYICNLLAMALRPDELRTIKVEDNLLSDAEAAIIGVMKPGRTKKFLIKYHENFWKDKGFSGEILSMRGPIIWAIERPTVTATGSIAKYSSLSGYLKVKEDNGSTRDAVVSQLVKLFGPEAAHPVLYKETDIADVYVPRCGDYMTLWKWLRWNNGRNLEWGALDIFADGDVVAALEAGHNAYVNVVTILRPQAQRFDDARVLRYPRGLDQGRFQNPLCALSYRDSLWLAFYASAAVMAYQFIKYIRN